MPSTSSTLATNGLAEATAAALASYGEAVPSGGSVPRSSPKTSHQELVTVPSTKGTTLACVDAAYKSLRTILDEAVIVDLRQSLESFGLLSETIAVLLSTLQGEGVEDLDLLASRSRGCGPGALTCSASPRMTKPQQQPRQLSKASGDTIDDLYLSLQSPGPGEGHEPNDGRGITLSNVSEC